MERVVRTGRNRVVRYDRERCLVNVSQNVSFIVCGIVFQRNSRFFFLFFSSPFPYFFPRIRWKEIFESRWIPSGFPKLKNRCFAGEKRKKRKEKTNWREKISQAHLAHRACSKRVRNVFVQYKPAESGLLFTLHGIHSSPAKRVKTQKSESLFVTSFDVAINSFEITAGYTTIYDNRRRFSLENSNFRQIAASVSPRDILDYVLEYVEYSISSSTRYLKNDTGRRRGDHRWGKRGKWRRAEETERKLLSKVNKQGVGGGGSWEKFCN